MPKLLIGLISFNDLLYLKETLPAVEELRRRENARVLIMDTAWNDEVKAFIESNYPAFEVLRDPEGNIGYGRSWNAILKHRKSAEFFLLVTSDVLLHVPTVQRFLRRMEKRPELSMVSGKLHFWDFPNRKLTDQIDSLGIVAKQSHHFFDRGQGEVDKGQYDEELDHFFGLTGAVFLLRTSVIPKLYGRAFKLFDEHFWMYKEDIDLSYRLRWLGEELALFPEVWAWHARTVSNRKGQTLKGLVASDLKKKSYARVHSYKNHLLLLKNNFSFGFGPGVFLRVFIYECAKAVFVFFRSPPAFFAGMKTLFFLRPTRSPRKVNPKQLLSFFS